MLRLIIISMLLIAGCQGGQSTVSPKTPETIRSTGQHIAAAATAVTSAGTEAQKLPESQPKGAIIAHIGTASGELQAAGKAAEVAEKSAERDAEKIAKVIQENQQLKNNDPVRKWLQLLSWTTIAAGVVLICLHFFWLRLAWSDDAGGALLAIGACIWTILTFAKVIMVGIIICAIAYAAYAIWREYRKTAKRARA